MIDIFSLRNLQSNLRSFKRLPRISVEQRSLFNRTLLKNILCVTKRRFREGRRWGWLRFLQ